MTVSLPYVIAQLSIATCQVPTSAGHFRLRHCRTVTEPKIWSQRRPRLCHVDQTGIPSFSRTFIRKSDIYHVHCLWRLIGHILPLTYAYFYKANIWCRTWFQVACAKKFLQLDPFPIFFWWFDKWYVYWWSRNEKCKKDTSAELKRMKSEMIKNS